MSTLGKPAFDPILGKMRSALKPGAGIDMSGGTVSVITPPEGVPYVAGIGIAIHGATVEADLTPGYRTDIAGGTISFNPSADIVTVTGASVTIQPDTAYKIYATTAAVTINANAPAAGKWSYEGHLEIFVAGTGYVVTGTNVVLANALEPDAVNNCVVRFHDGVAIIDVEDHIAGYIVVSTSGTTSGTLPYGITSATQEYLAFDATTNGAVVDLGGSTASGEKHIVGNGYTSTTLTGSVDCGTSKFTVANLSLQDVIVGGGTMTLGDAYIPSGSTVAVSGGGLAVERVTGDGGVIDLGGTNVNISSGATASVSSCTFTSGTGTYGAITTTKATVSFDSVKITGNTANRGGVYINAGYTEFKNCFLSGNGNADISAAYGSALLSGGVCGYYKVDHDAEAILAGNVTVGRLMGQYVSSAGRFGSVTIISGAVVNLTSSINPGGGITVLEGGCTVNGNAIAAGTYTSIDSTGTPT